MKITAEPRSDQLNADELIGTTRTVTIAGVKPGAAEQKYDIVLVGEKRVWRPPLTVLRLLLAAWGDEASNWVGKHATLYGDPTVRFGNDAVGGIRVSHLSHIDGPLTVKSQIKRGKRAPVTVEPISEIDALRAEWQNADPERRAEIEAEVAALQNGADQ